MKTKKLQKMIQNEIEKNGSFGFYSYADDAYCIMFEVQGALFIEEFVSSPDTHLAERSGLYVAKDYKQWIKIRKCSILLELSSKNLI